MADDRSGEERPETVAETIPATSAHTKPPDGSAAPAAPAAPAPRAAPGAQAAPVAPSGPAPGDAAHRPPVGDLPPTESVDAWESATLGDQPPADAAEAGTIAGTGVANDAPTIAGSFAVPDTVTLRPATPAAPGDLRPVDDRRYSEFRVLGIGGMGIVYRALDGDLNRTVAFKVVRPDAGGRSRAIPPDPITLRLPPRTMESSRAFAAMTSRFLQEAWVTAGLEHPGIVPVHEVGRTPEGVPYYTMRFIRGSRTLDAAIAEAVGKPLDERLVLLEPYLKVCDTIRYAHAHGVVHRDLKPANIALGEFGEVFVLDWGLAKTVGQKDEAVATWQARIAEFREATDMRTLASALGTPGYMAPEAALGLVDRIDARSDVYSLGAILHEILTGKLPFEFRTFHEFLQKLTKEEARDPRDLAPDVPEALAAICLRALARDRAARTATVDALAAAVRGWLAEQAEDREVAVLLQAAQTSLEESAGLEGEQLLLRLDGAAVAVAQILARRPEDARARELHARIATLRSRGVDERAHAVRRAALRRAGIAVLVVAVVAGVVVARALDRRAREAEQARAETAVALGNAERERARAETERDAKDRASRRAAALLLAAQSEASLATEPALALALAIESAERMPSTHANDALLEALLLRPERWSLGAFRLGAAWAAIDARGTRLVAGGLDGTGRTWDVASGSPGPDVAGSWTAARPFADGRLLLVGRSAAAVVDPSEGRVAATFVPPPSEGLALTDGAVSADGACAVTWCTIEDPRRLKSRVFRWDTSSGAVIHVADLGADVFVESGALSPDGGTALLATSDAVWTWTPPADPVSIDVPRTRYPGAETHEPALLGAWFDGAEPRFARTLALPEPGAAHDAPPRRTLAVCDARTGAVLATAGPADPVVAAEAFPDGSWVALAHPDGSAELRALGRRAAPIPLAGGFPFDPQSPLGSVFSVSPDAKHVVARPAAGLRVWDARSGALVARLETAAGHAAAAVFSADGRFLAVPCSTGSVRVWDLGTPPGVVTVPGSAGALSVAYLSAAEIVVPGETVRVHDARTGDLIRETPPELGSAWAVPSPGGAAVLTQTALLDGPTLAVLAAAPGRMRAASWSPDGRRAVWTTWSKEPALVVDAAARTAEPLGEGGTVYDGIAVHPSGRWAALGGWDGAIDVWDLDRRTRLARLSEHSAAVLSLAFTPDGTHLVAGSHDGRCSLWATDGWRRVAAWDGAPAPGGPGASGVSALDVAADGRAVAVASFHGSATVFELPTLAARIVVSPRAGPLVGVRFSPDGSRLVTRAEDGKAQAWDARTGAEVVRFGRVQGASGASGGAGSGGAGAGLPGRSPVAPGLSIAFSPDGQRVAVAAGAGPVRVWPVDPLSAARAVRGRSLTAGERSDFLAPLDAAAESRQAAARFVDRAQRTLRLKDLVVAAVRDDPGLDAATRAFALELAAALRDEPAELAQAAWNVAHRPGEPEAAYRLALSWADAAARLAPGDWDVRNSLGVAQYRCGDFAVAAETLAACDAARAESESGPRAEDVAFLAMALSRSGRADEARVQLARLRGLLGAPADRPGDETPESAMDAPLRLLREAEAVVAGGDRK